MKKNRSKKKYKPKYVAVNPMSTFLGGMSIEHAEHLQALRIKNHGAMANMMVGTGSRDDWDRLVGAVNMANVMCEQGIGDEFRQIMIATRDALCECGKRAMKSGGQKFLLKGDEIALLNEFLDAHDAQVTNVRAIDIERAADEVLRRIRHRINSTNVRAELAKEEAADQV